LSEEAPRELPVTSEGVSQISEDAQ
jgi:hypothetical protein